MGLGWAAIADLALKAFGGFAAGKANQNQAKAQKKANEADYAAKKGFWEDTESHRGVGMDQAAALLGNIQPSLGKGAPNYTVSPETLALMKQPRRYPGALPADPTAGSTWALLGSMANQGGQGLQTYQLGKILQQQNAENGPLVDGYIDYDKIGAQSVNRPVGTPSAGFGGGEDRSRVCALNPRLPGCGGGGE